MQSFNFFIGIDQTGAVVPGHPARARPLPCAFFDVQSRRLSWPEQGLSELHPQKLHSQLTPNSRPALLLDCVLGLPDAIGGWPRFEQALGELGKWERENPEAPFGRAAAEAYFAQLLGNRSEIPTRGCEVLAQANSVFKSRPYQKNIQTGTYRLWRELSRNRAAFALWPSDSLPETTTRSPPPIPIFEGFPSLLWKKYFGFSSRQPGELPAALSRLGIPLSTSQSATLAADADLCDAVVLAVGGWILAEQGLLGPSALAELPESWQRQALREGWIAGLLAPQGA